MRALLAFAHVGVPILQLLSVPCAALQSYQIPGLSGVQYLRYSTLAEETRPTSWKVRRCELAGLLGLLVTDPRPPLIRLALLALCCSFAAARMQCASRRRGL